jgi:translation initiation factor IF-3
LRKTYRPRFRKPEPALYRVNRAIIVPEVRLVDETGANVGVVSLEEALRRAEAAELDLVEVSPLANPPVAKILNYHQLKYRQDKESQKQKANQKRQETKGIRLSLRISQHDQDMRLAQAMGFLDDGHKLKFELILRGREQQHKALAATLIESFVERLRQQYRITVEQPVQKQGGRLSLICYSNGKLTNQEAAASQT